MAVFTCRLKWLADLTLCVVYPCFEGKEGPTPSKNKAIPKYFTWDWSVFTPSSPGPILFTLVQLSQGTRPFLSTNLCVAFGERNCAIGANLVLYRSQNLKMLLMKTYAVCRTWCVEWNTDAWCGKVRRVLRDFRSKKRKGWRRYVCGEGHLSHLIVE